MQPLSDYSVLQVCDFFWGEGGGCSVRSVKGGQVLLKRRKQITYRRYVKPRIGPSYLGSCSKLHKARLSVCLFVCLPVRPSVCNNSPSHWTDFHEIWHLRISRKSIMQVSLKSDTNNTLRYKRAYAQLWQLAEFFVEWEMFKTKDVEKIKIRILRSITSFPKIVPLMTSCGKIWYSRRGHRWHNNPAHALWTLDT